MMVSNDNNVSELEDVEDMEMGDPYEDEEGGFRVDDIYIPPPPPAACTFDATGPRLVISHIFNENFKSYAGRHVLGPFHKNFSSIIGPNGSGKSNVIDSMLFVFGYRAQKIRSKKISVLIHNSDEHPNLDRCTVAVHFCKIIDEEDKFTKVENSEFVISRTAFRDNSSYYEINGKRSQFKDVGKLLRSQGVDLDHNRFLILQGEVEQISLMKPKAETPHDTGMLEFLEDVIGSVRYKEPLDKLTSKVGELNELRQEKLGRVKLVQQEKDELEGPRNQAIDFLKQENNAVHLENIDNQFQLLDCKVAMEGAEAKKKEIDDGMSDLKKQLEEFAEQRKEKTDKLNEFTKRYNEIVKEKDRLKEEFRKYDKEDTNLAEEMKHKNTARKKAQANLKKEKENVETYTNAPEENAAKIEELSQHQETLEEERAKTETEIEKVMATLRDETQALQDEKEQFENQLSELQPTTTKAKTEMSLAKSDVEVYTGNEAREKAIYEKLQKTYDTSHNMIKERTSQIKELQKSIQSKEKELRECEQELQPIQRREKEIEGVLRQNRVELQEARSSMQASSSNSRVVSALMEQRKKNIIPGIIGRLGNLGAIDGKYDVAISTACGGLDNIVVDTADTAQACINFLKNNNVGIATFIILDKQQRWWEHCRKKINTPESVPRLFDLITVKDESVLPAFYFCLRDTLVADNIEQASRIAYGKTRYRVVTLQGDLIELSGTMSGGGSSKNVCRGRMGRTVQVSDAEINKLQTQVDKLSQEYDKLHSRRVEIEEKLPTLQTQIKKDKIELKKYTMDLKSTQETLEPLEQQINEQKVKVREAAPDPKKVEKLQKIADTLTAEYEKAKAASDLVEKSVKKLHDKIMQVTQDKMKGIEKKRQNITERLNKITSEISRLTANTKTAQRNLTKSKNLVEKHEKEVKSAEERMAEISERKKEIEKSAKEVLESTANLESEEVEVTKGGSEMKKEIDKMSEKENELKKQKLDVDHEIAKYQQIIDSKKHESDKLKKLLKKLKLNEIPKVDGDDENEEQQNTELKIFKETELRMLSEEELKEFDRNALKMELVALRENLQDKRPNLGCIAEYDKKEKLYLERVQQLSDVTAHRDKIQKYKDDVKKRRLTEFMDGFCVITNKLKELYQMVTLGGDAELDLVDSMDPFSEGIVFSVRPPKKSWKNISNLSGGEKTLSSLSLVFALHYYKTTPFYVMDEIDAALDFKNVSIVAHYIKRCTKNAQFIIISLRTEMFELADRLVGIFKTDNVTKSITIDPGLFEKGLIQHDNANSETGENIPVETN